MSYRTPLSIKPRMNKKIKINYQQILKINMINVLKDILKEIQKNGLQDGHLLYITFKTKNVKVVMPKWLYKKFPDEMTIVIQHEYWNFSSKENFFNIGLSFNDIKTNLSIPYDSIVSFADPYANFGLQLIQGDLKNVKKTKRKTASAKSYQQNNVIEFNKFKNN